MKSLDGKSPEYQKGFVAGFREGGKYALHAVKKAESKEYSKTRYK